MTGDHLERVKAFLDLRREVGQSGVIAATAALGMRREKLTDDDLRALVAEVQKLRAETHQARALMPKLIGLAWRNGWADHAQAQQDVGHQANRQRDGYEKRFVAESKGWVSELSAELAAGVVPQQPERDSFVDLATRTHLNYVPDDDQREQDSAVSGGDGGAWGRQPERGADADGVR